MLIGQDIEWGLRMLENALAVVRMNILGDGEQSEIQNGFATVSEPSLGVNQTSLGGLSLMI